MKVHYRQLQGQHEGVFFKMTESCKNVKIVNVCWKWDMMSPALASLCSCLYLFWAIRAALYLRPPGVNYPAPAQLFLLRHCSHHTSFHHKTLPILIQAKDNNSGFSSQVRISSECEWVTNERALAWVTANQRPDVRDHRGGGRRVPRADQHNQCYQCRDQVLLSTNDLTLLSQQFQNHFILTIIWIFSCILSYALDGSS